MDTIILIAIKDEAPVTLLHQDNVFFTGVGKVNAATHAARLIEQYKPKRIINFGTAGGITVGAGLHHCTRFVQRDMNCTDLGFSAGQTPFESSIAIGTTEGLTCSTGDNFVSTPTLEIPADIVDMEAYAIAKACYYSSIEFICFKYVTDSADTNASTDWKQTVSLGEKHYINKLKELSIY
jgi:adenosylhomocysteine nucleosidase|tara:strand:- start:103 stop:642 length:540 start_codon:yes stop_codon:yes gene_type:complete